MSSTSPFRPALRFAEARAVLNRWCNSLDGKDASTNKAVKRHANPDGLNDLWWLENAGTTPDWQNNRTRAYLAAYVELGGGVIPMSGIPVAEGFIWPDRAVIRTLLLNRCIEQGGRVFGLTERGRALLAEAHRAAGRAPA
ncbi:hypothetical protein [Zavarzinia sp. CC-PAN008]|uniref:hypothetical protein n=1 Tax=Zavarzinia sp. CC-PAN008 TaxID=3243332 RepID=UPI003F74308D